MNSTFTWWIWLAVMTVVNLLNPMSWWLHLTFFLMCGLVVRSQSHVRMLRGLWVAEAKRNKTLLALLETKEPVEDELDKTARILGRNPDFADVMKKVNAVMSTAMSTAQSVALVNEGWSEEEWHDGMVKYHEEMFAGMTAPPIGTPVVSRKSWYQFWKRK